MISGFVLRYEWCVLRGTTFVYFSYFTREGWGTGRTNMTIYSKVSGCAGALMGVWGVHVDK